MSAVLNINLSSVIHFNFFLHNKGQLLRLQNLVGNQLEKLAIELLRLLFYCLGSKRLLRGIMYQSVYG